jgi:anti-anti-sigma factor
MPATTNLIYSTRDGVVVAQITNPTIAERDTQGLLFDLSEAVKQTGGRLILDLSQVLMVTSAGLGMFINVRKACLAAGPQGKAVLCNVAPEIKTLLEITKLQKLFPMVTDLEAAMKEFH